MRVPDSPTFKAPSADDPVLKEVVHRLVEVYHPEMIYLFGSAARGDAGPDSDYDFMVVVPDDAPAGLQDCRMGYRALSGLGVAKDILVWTRNEFDKRLPLKASLPSTVVEEGQAALVLARELAEAILSRLPREVRL